MRDSGLSLCPRRVCQGGVSHGLTHVEHNVISRLLRVVPDLARKVTVLLAVSALGHLIDPVHAHREASLSRERRTDV